MRDICSIGLTFIVTSNMTVFLRRHIILSYSPPHIYVCVGLSVCVCTLCGITVQLAPDVYRYVQHDRFSKKACYIKL